MQQLQLNLASDERMVLDRIIEEQLVQLMAEVMLALIAREREAGDDGQSS